MSDNGLVKALEILNKTEDRLIVWDSARDQAFVVMNLAEYQRLIFDQADIRDLTEDQLLHRINRDIAVWKSSQENQPDPENFANESQENTETETDQTYYFEPVDQL